MASGEVAAGGVNRSRLSRTKIERWARVLKYGEDLEEDDRLTPAVTASLDKAADIATDKDIVVYIAGALTGVSEETKIRYERTSELIGSYLLPPAEMFGYAPHLHGTDPVQHPDVTPDEVRDIDYLWAVKMADYHINFRHPQADGNAVEQGWAEAHRIPSLYVSPREHRQSRLLLGMRNIAGTVLYDSFEEEGLPQIAQFFDKVQSERMTLQTHAIN